MSTQPNLSKIEVEFDMKIICTHHLPPYPHPTTHQETHCVAIVLNLSSDQQYLIKARKQGHQGQHQRQHQGHYRGQHQQQYQGQLEGEI